MGSIVSPALMGVTLILESASGHAHKEAPPLELRTYIDLPAHRGRAAFDHADVDPADGRIYLAHTGNDAVDEIDTTAQRWATSIEGLQGVAGVLLSPSWRMLFTSNRDEDTVAVIPLGGGRAEKVAVDSRPNGLAFDPGRGLLLVAH